MTVANTADTAAAVPPAIVARFTLDEAYYRQSVQEIYRHRKPHRRWLVPVSVVLVVAGIAIMAVAGPDRLIRAIGAIPFGIGAVELLSPVWVRWRWLRARKSAPTFGGTAEIRFTPEGLDNAGPVSRGMIAWRDIPRVQRADAGLFLPTGKGESIYVPFAALARPEDADAIEALHAAATRPAAH